MADDKKKPAPSGGGSKSNTEVLGTIFGIIFGLLLLSSIIGGAERVVGDRFDGNFSFLTFFSRFSDAVTDTTPLGTLITARRDTSVWKSFLHETLAGAQQGGSTGRLLAGPVVDDAGSWWNVDFELSPDGWVDADDIAVGSGWLAQLKRIYTWIAWIVSLVALAGVVYVSRKHKEVTKEHEAHMKILEQKIAGVGVANRNEKWEHITELIASENPGDWRVAILEADIMLDELVTTMGHHGDTLGEKMKGIEQSDFKTLESAWEAHKIRNRIAHHGSDFILTHREAKRVIDLFREVFQEFDVV